MAAAATSDAWDAPVDRVESWEWVFDTLWTATQQVEDKCFVNVRAPVTGCNSNLNHTATHVNNNHVPLVQCVCVAPGTRHRPLPTRPAVALDWYCTGWLHHCQTLSSKEPIR